MVTVRPARDTASSGSKPRRLWHGGGAHRTVPRYHKYIMIFYDFLQWNTRARIYKMSKADVWRMPK